MRLLWVLVLMSLVCQVPAATFVTRDGFACRSPELWMQYAKAIDKSDAKTIRNIRLSQRCVDLLPGEVEVIERLESFLKIKAHTGRTLYIPKAYVKE